MLSKGTIKRLTSLRIKKFREEQGVFTAEGARLVDELAGSSLTVRELYYTPEWSGRSPAGEYHCQEVSSDEMRRISSLTAPSSVFAVVDIPEYGVESIDFANELTLALDTVQDPGNLGTIVRLASWFGIGSVMCSRSTADIFAPKAVQATMGAIARVRVVYCDLAEGLAQLSGQVAIYGAFMDGLSIYEAELYPRGVVVLGNEGNGISPAVERLVSQRLHIPSFAADRPGVESLNVAMAAAIICSEFRRR